MRRSVLPLLLAVLLPACGPDEAPQVEIPSWAKVAPEQIAEAKKHGVPVAFENDLGMRFVLIPAGTFMAGMPEAVPHHEDEAPYEATISMPFYMSVYEVTNAQFKSVLRDHNSGTTLFGGTLTSDDQPVVRVSWSEACAFAKELSARERGRTYRLPREDEWEYACRAGTVTRFYFGDGVEDLHQYAHVQAPFDKADLSTDLDTRREQLKEAMGTSAPVGSYRPNGWGLYDMHGNVCEWCARVRVPHIPGRDKDYPAHMGASDECLLRGGGWYDGTGHIGAAKRYHRGWGGEHIGFRLVSPLPEPGE